MVAHGRVPFGSKFLSQILNVDFDTLDVTISRRSRGGCTNLALIGALTLTSSTALLRLLQLLRVPAAIGNLQN